MVLEVMFSEVADIDRAYLTFLHVINAFVHSMRRMKQHLPTRLGLGAIDDLDHQSHARFRNPLSI